MAAFPNDRFHTPRFTSLDDVDRPMFFAAFAAAATSSIMLTAPSSNHRLTFRAHDKEKLLFRANRFAIVGIAFLALAIASVVHLINPERRRVSKRPRRPL